MIHACITLAFFCMSEIGLRVEDGERNQRGDGKHVMNGIEDGEDGYV